MKTCLKCGQEKPLWDFAKTARPGHRAARCKACDAAHKANKPEPPSIRLSGNPWLDLGATTRPNWQSKSPNQHNAATREKHQELRI